MLELEYTCLIHKHHRNLHILYYSIPPGVFRIVNIYPSSHLITAYSPRGYVISQAYWAASHQWHRGNLTERISGLKPPCTSLFLLTTHSIAPYHAHFSYRTPKPDTNCGLDLNLYNRLSRYCQWLHYQRNLVAFNTLYSLLRGTIWDLMMAQWKGRNM